MPYFCRSLVSQALNHRLERSLKGSRVLVLGVAYKPDIGDMRESPALKLIELLDERRRGRRVPRPARAGARRGRARAALRGLEPAAYDCVVIVTDHADRLRALVERAGRRRPAERDRPRGIASDKVWKL